ncbi:MAG: hypothetical protein A2W01_02410 [Candidatus Solincola sediminis]|nr:MAG: hypothetical protein A2W01_02410 [Candidatus Solincola sediminis]
MVIPSYRFWLNDNVIETRRIPVFTIDDIPPDVFLRVGGGNPVDLSRYDGGASFSLGSIRLNGIQKYTLDSANLLDEENASFEAGLWNEKPFDCSDEMPGDPQMSMEISEDATDGQEALLISSQNHYAGTLRTFPVKMQGEHVYKLSFDYRTLSGHKVMYFVDMKSARDKRKSVTQTIATADSKWHTAEVVLDPTYDDATEVDIWLYAPSFRNEDIVNLYDNLILTEYAVEEIPLPDSQIKSSESLELAENLSLLKGDNFVTRFWPTDNMLDQDLASFETGLWSEEPMDCSMDMEGEPIMSAEISNDASDGSQALRLSSDNHYAGSLMTFPARMERNYIYKLSFDYKTVSGNDAMYYVNMKSASGQEKASIENLTTTDSDWHTLETALEPPFDDVTQVEVCFYAPSDGNKSIVNLYDNVKVVPYWSKNLNQCYLFSPGEVSGSGAIKAVEYKRTSRYQTKVILHGASGTLLLRSRDRFSPKWALHPLEKTPAGSPSLSIPAGYQVLEKDDNRQASAEEVGLFIAENKISAVGSGFISKDFGASIRNDNLPNPPLVTALGGNTIPEAQHFELNGHENAWLVDVDELARNGYATDSEGGGYDVVFVIESKALLRSYAALLILGLAILVCVAFTLFHFNRWVKEMRNRSAKI